MDRMQDQQVDDDWISIGSLFSDDSSFHGDGIAKEQHEADVAAYDPIDFWKVQKWNVQRIAAELPTDPSLLHGTKRKIEEVSLVQEHGSASCRGKDSHRKGVPDNKDLRSPTTIAMRPFNPYEGIMAAKQLEESLDDFLSRLPPSITTTATGPWIWVANPTSEYRPLNEDIAGFTRQGNGLLEGFLSQKSELERQRPNKATAAITRMLSKERVELEHGIDTLAKQHNVKCGKWMLFPATEHVDQAWATVARSILSGDLGCSAKVSTVDTDEKSNAHHLICIYTVDYSDLGDVKRVLRRMRQLGLVDDSSSSDVKKRPIYYKCDAYTCLDISRGNAFGLKVSLYNSKDLFIEMKKEGTFL